MAKSFMQIFGEKLYTPDNNEDVTDETAAYTEKLELLANSVTALESELEGKLSGGSSSGGSTDSGSSESSGNGGESTAIPLYKLVCTNYENYSTPNIYYTRLDEAGTPVVVSRMIDYKSSFEDDRAVAGSILMIDNNYSSFMYDVPGGNYIAGSSDWAAYSVGQSNAGKTVQVRIDYYEY